MTSFSAVRQALADQLSLIAGLNTYATLPASVIAPAGIVTPGRDEFLTFDSSMGRGSDDLHLLILLLVAAGDEQLAQDQLDPYLDGSGPRSIKEVVDGPLGVAGHYAIVRGARAWGVRELGGQQFWGAELPVDVSADGF